MSQAASADPASLTHIVWMWQSNPNPWSESELAEWSHYSDVRSLIIEEAFSAKQPGARLHGYYIDFEHMVQISNDDDKKQTRVRRMVGKRKDKHLRKERIMFDPIAPKRPLGGEYGWVSPFIEEVRRDLRFRRNQLPSKDKDIIPMLVEKAADGIIEEGKQIGKLEEEEAEKLAGLLRKKKDKGMQEVWICCAHLYSLNSFLYRKLNEVMRFIGNENHEQIWRSKIRTLGPFALLLWDDPFNKKMKTETELYRGANLTSDQIATYEDMAKCRKAYRSFQAFTSCSRNREVAEMYGENALFIMNVLCAFTSDISPFSQFSDEEEELVTPGVCFSVQHVKFDKETNKHTIHLHLRQRFSNNNIHEIASPNETNAITDEYDPADVNDDLCRNLRRLPRLARFALTCDDDDFNAYADFLIRYRLSQLANRLDSDRHPLALARLADLERLDINALLNRVGHRNATYTYTIRVPTGADDRLIDFIDILDDLGLIYRRDVRDRGARYGTNYDRDGNNVDFE